MNEARSISVVVTATDFYSHTPELFQSLEAQTFDDFHVIVVDDASSDGCELSSFGRAMVLRNVKPYGFARSINQGIALSLARWASHNLKERFVLFIQPDMILSAESMKELFNELRKNPNIDVVGPTIYHAKKIVVEEEGFDVEFTDQEMHAGFCLTKGRRLVWCGEGANESQKGKLFGVSPDCFLVRASLLEKMGTETWLDERLGRLPALIDFFWNIREHGGAMRVVRDAAVWKQAPSPVDNGSVKSLSDRLELQEVHIKHSPFTLRLRHSPWLFWPMLTRLPALFGFEGIRRHLKKMPYRFRLGKERRIRQKKLGIGLGDMTPWFL